MDKLRHGGMGVVFKSKQAARNRLVALKMLRSIAETEAIARLQPPNVVQVFEVAEYVARPYLAMEYVEGGSLALRLAAGPHAPVEAATLAEVFSRAMQAAHTAGVIHRDLKPANFLLTLDGTPKVTEFGPAKYVEEESCISHSGVVIGIPPIGPRNRQPETSPRWAVYAQSFPPIWRRCT